MNIYAFLTTLVICLYRFAIFACGINITSSKDGVDA
jgi:hypothetical protein